MQNQTSAHDEHDHILWFEKHPIRIVQRHDGVPYFAVPDLCAAMGRETCSQRVLDTIPDHAKFAGCQEEADSGLEPISMLTPVGAWWLTHNLDAYRGQKLAAWTRRVARDLCPNPAPDDPAMFLTVDAQGQLPPRPTKYTGRHTEWTDLRYSDAYLNSRINSYVESRRKLLEEAVAAHG